MANSPVDPAPASTRGNALSELAIRFTDWTERWVPDAFIFALLATVLVCLLGVAVAKAGPLQIVDSWGKGFWELIPFTMQMALVIITGYVVASTPSVYRLITWLAARPKTPKGAVAFVAVFALAVSASIILAAGFLWQRSRPPLGLSDDGSSQPVSETVSERDGA